MEHQVMRIHLLEYERFSNPAFEALNSLGKVTFGSKIDDSFLVDVLFVRLARSISGDFLEKSFPGVRYILSPTTGHDHLDTTYLEKKGIKLISLKGEEAFLRSITSTAEHTWALLLSLVRNLPAASRHALDGQWNRDLFIGNTLAGKNLGILGFGRVGTQVARFAHAFQMNVHAYDVREKTYPDYVTGYLDFDSFASKLEILCIHIPLDHSTTNWLNSSRISKLKSGIKIINTSRGGVWDESFLADRIKSGEISGVATDVLSNELQTDLLVHSPLIACAKQGLPVIITPHIAGACLESMHRTEEFVVSKLIREISG